MSKRRVIWIALGVVLTVLAVWLVVGVGGGPREPVYQGKALSVWLEGSYDSSGSPGRHEAPKAVRHIGTNAIPALLRMIRAKDPPPLIQKLLVLVSKQNWIKIQYRSANHSHYLADPGFEVLGTNAACAVPELVSICADARYPASQEYATRALGHIGPPAKAAIPLLLCNSVHTNDDVRLAAVTALVKIESDSRMLVPVLKRALRDSNRNVRSSAVSKLHSYARGDAYSRSNALLAVPG